MDQCARELLAIWNRPFRIWMNPDDWQPVNSLTADNDWDESLLPAAVLDRGLAATTPFTVKRPNGNTVLVVAVQAPGGQQAVATTQIGPHADELADILVRMTSILAEQQQAIQDQSRQLASYANQLGSDFDELVWLRQLSGSLREADEETFVTEAAEKLLPSLGLLLGTECLALIEASSEEERFPIHEPVYETGTRDLTRDDVRKIITRCSNLQSNSAVICNDVEDVVLSDGCRLSSFAVVRISYGGHLSGWIVAVNRRVSALVRQGVDYDPQFDRFDDRSASLLESAAATVAIHSTNNELTNGRELLLTGVLRSLINAIDAKDPYTCGHSDRVALIGRCIGQQIGLDENECRRLYLTGLLHDVGKIGVPDLILNKPTKLTTAEFRMVQQHTVIGYDILKHIQGLGYVLPGVLYHHEAYDGSGYPHALKGDDIPLVARILAVADSYDAMTGDRPYRDGMPTERAEHILRQGAGTQWDEQIVDAFFDCLDEIHSLCEVANTRLNHDDTDMPATVSGPRR